MIDNQLYRARIGVYNPNKIPRSSKINRNKPKPNLGPGITAGNFLDQINNTKRNFCLLTYLYFIIIILSLTLSMAKSLKTTPNFSLHSLHCNTNSLNDTALNYIRYFFCIIFSYAVLSVKITNMLENTYFIIW